MELDESEFGGMEWNCLEWNGLDWTGVTQHEMKWRGVE